MTKQLKDGAILGKSEFSKFKTELKATRCKICWGTGSCDDAEPGDISFEEWVCTGCNGTGLNPALKDNLFNTLVVIGNIIESIKEGI